jgi:hypothetical protein
MEITCIAYEDLSACQFHLVKVVCYDTTNNSPRVSLCGDGEKPVGILQNNPIAGKPANVMVEGKSQCVIGEALSCGQSYASDANGHAVGAVAEDWIAGQVIEPGTLSATPTSAERTTVLVETKNPWQSYPTWTDSYG